MERALVEYILNALWQAPMLAAGAWLLVRLARPTPAVQHWIWLAVLAAMMAMPWRGVSGRSAAAEPAYSDIGAAPPTAVASAASTMPTAAPLFAPARKIEIQANAARWLTWMFLGAFLLGAVRLAWAFIAARRLVRRAADIRLPRPTLEIFERCGRSLGVKLPALRESSGVAGPVVVGAWRPVLLLPQNFPLHLPIEAEAAFCHELAHVRRRDALVNLLCEAVGLPLAWHPAMYAAQRRIRATREMACDAIAAAEMRSELGYAKCLVALAENMLGGGRGAPQTLGLFDNNRMEERIMRLMRTQTAMSARARITRIAIGTAAMTLAAAMAMVFHVTPTLAQAQSSARPAASAGPAAQSAPAAPKGELGIPGLVAVARGRTASVLQGDKGEYIHRWQGADGQPFVILNRSPQEPTAAEKRLIERKFVAWKGKIENIRQHVNSPEFKQRMQKIEKMKIELKLPDLQKQIDAATAQVNSLEFQRQMEATQKQLATGELQRQMAKMQKQFQSQDFQRRMEETSRTLAQKQMSDTIKKATAQMNSPEFQRQMEAMQKQLENGQLQREMAKMQKQFQSQDFQRRMEETSRTLAQKQMSDTIKKATAQLNSPAFQRQMEAMQKQLATGELQRQMEEAARKLRDAQQQMKNLQIK